MKISRLRLLGFKSFVEPTELVIEPGLTGVVGPNGCGKSNLLEALRWVMGETSHKSMRAAAMDDVIFSGTTTRPARVAAEVTMFLDNAERQAPAEYNDRDTIEITRRIEREAGSAYRINGKEARARDIKILFEDAATGARSPALVRQGQIGEIVNAKPEQRRRILEDAAGIAGMHSRRHEAELRLRAAEANLARLNDVLGQVTSQIETLKRQARQARRYKEISEEIRRQEALQLHLSWTQAQAAVDAEEAALKAALETLTTAITAEAAAVMHEAAAGDALPPLRQAEAERAAALHRVKVEAETFEREAKRAEERREELEARAAQLGSDIVREETLIREAHDLIQRFTTEITEIETAQAAAADGLGSAKAAEQSAAQSLAAGERALIDVTQRAAEARAARRALEMQRDERRLTRERLERQLQSLAGQLAALTASAPDLGDASSLAERCETLSAEIEATEEAMAEAEEQHARLTQDVATRRQAAASARLAAKALTTERETLARLLGSTRDDRHAAILDQLRVARGLETALGAALGDDLDAPVADDAPVRWHLVARAEDDPELPEGATPLTRHVKGPAEIARRLQQIGVVAAEDGPRLQKLLRPGQRLVSRAGDLWRWDGFIAEAGGTSAAAQRLEQRNRLAALEFEEAEAREAESIAAEAEASVAAELAQAETRTRLLRQSLRTAQNALLAARDEQAAAERRARETQGRIASLTEGRARAEDDLAEAVRREMDVTASFAALAPADAVESELAEARRIVDDSRATHIAAAAQVAELSRAEKSRGERLTIATAERQRWSSRSEGAQGQIATLKERQQAARSELDALADLPRQLEDRRQQLLDAIASADAQRQEAADRLAAAEGTLREAQKALREAHSSVADGREVRARVESRLEAARQRRQDEARRIREALGVIPEGCLPLAGYEADAELPPLADVERQLAKLKTDRDRLGGVNLAADEELTTLGSQFETLDAERRDVEEAIAKLRGAIQQLNREAKKRLDQAFETVNRHFARLFTTLFGGGEARLEMVASEDPLEGGLEIIAKPPGKKPATLSLLSGGEQTLTALSLIFAVFLTNPSPICVLDEVDAPLDDANVDRFCTLMEKMASETATRFLVITHHPMTMARMNRLFGVTMAERGVSQLVSVNLETAHGFLEAV